MAAVAVLLLAGQGVAEARMAYAGWSALSEAELAAQRGGFLTDEGLRISLGLADVVRINGELRARTLFEQRTLSGPLAEALDPDERLRVIQNGAGAIANVQQLREQLSGFSTLIQNNLDNQTIQHTRTLDIDASGYSDYRNLRLRETLNSVLIGSLR